MEFLTFSQKLLLWRHDVEARVLSRDSGDYLKVLVGNVNHSTSVSLRFTCFNFISYILWFTLFTLFPEVWCHSIRWGIRFHRFFGHI